MAKIDIDVSCLLCDNHYRAEIELPTGFIVNDVCDELALCPDHAIIDEWRHTACSGCVGGFGECDLWRAFAYSRDKQAKKLTEEEFATIERGTCPRKTNGSFMVERPSGTITDITPKDAAPEAGKALAKAIREYIERYKNG